MFHGTKFHDQFQFPSVKYMWSLLRHASLIKRCEDTKFGFCAFTRTEESLDAIIPFVKPQEKEMSSRERMSCLPTTSCTVLPPTTAGRSYGSERPVEQARRRAPLCCSIVKRAIVSGCETYHPPLSFRRRSRSAQQQHSALSIPSRAHYRWDSRFVTYR